MMFWLGSLLFRLIAPPDLSKVAGILRRARSLDNRAMDADEFARIEVTLLTAIAEAKVVVRRFGVSAQFREVVPSRTRDSRAVRRRDDRKRAAAN